MKSNHGGFREGAGRKANYDEPTKVIRVPESRVIEIKNYLVKSKEARFNDIASITLVDPSISMHIPLASEKVAAGFPSPAQDYVDKTLDMNEHLIKNEAATFVVKVASLSMRDAGIEIDDELIDFIENNTMPDYQYDGRYSPVNLYNDILRRERNEESYN